MIFGIKTKVVVVVIDNTIIFDRYSSPCLVLLIDLDSLLLLVLSFAIILDIKTNVTPESWLYYVLQ